jgi:hypothetical protein
LRWDNTYRTISAISGFRDFISMSVIPIAWARSGAALWAPCIPLPSPFTPWIVDIVSDGTPFIALLVAPKEFVGKIVN